MKRKITTQPVLGGVEITFRSNERKWVAFVWRNELRELLRLIEDMITFHKL